jgi:hypothetical protein
MLMNTGEGSHVPRVRSDGNTASSGISVPAGAARSAESPVQSTTYVCPGETYSISRSIHLARLAAFYPNCRDCPHRFDDGPALPNPAAAQLLSATCAVSRSSLVAGERVRAVYLNELDRNRAIQWGEALAAHLWDRHPMMARRDCTDHLQITSVEPETMPAAEARGPLVVVGFDERPSSPDIVNGLVLGLRRMGCPVIDLGQTGLPVVSFHVHELKAFAAVYVTGAGCDPSWTGFEFRSQNSIPFSRDDLLKLEESVKEGVGRQTRQIGSYRTCQGIAAYESSLVPHFHALRPLTIVAGSSTRLMPRIMDRLFAKLPCRVAHITCANRQRQLLDPRDVDLQRVAAAVQEGNHPLGVLFDDDGEHLAFITNSGRLVAPQEIARLVIEITLRETCDAQFVVPAVWRNDVKSWLIGRDAVVIDGGETASQLTQQLASNKASIAFATDGRLWFQQGYPACDVLIVLARVLQALSLSDAPFSDVLARFRPVGS